MNVGKEKIMRVKIIATQAAIAIPNLISARMAGNKGGSGGMSKPKSIWSGKTLDKPATIPSTMKLNKSALNISSPMQPLEVPKRPTAPQRQRGESSSPLAGLDITA